MQCRFVLLDDGTSSSYPEPDPQELANRTDLTGYYWATAYYNGDETQPIAQFWFYPWTTDDAGASRGMAVIFHPEHWDADGTVTRWGAQSAYTVGFKSYQDELHCAARNPNWDAQAFDVMLIPWFDMIPFSCKQYSAELKDSPHSAPPGCDQ